MAEFPAVRMPDYPVEEQLQEPEVLITRFRDGSEQRRLKGAGQRRMFRLNFGDTPLTKSEADEFLAHYAANTMLTAFDWNHPERATTYLVRYASAPRLRHVGLDAYELEVELQEVSA